LTNLNFAENLLLNCLLNYKKNALKRNNNIITLSLFHLLLSSNIAQSNLIIFPTASTRWKYVSGNRGWWLRRKLL